MLVLKRPQAPGKKSTKKEKSVDLNIDFFVYTFKVEGFVSRNQSLKPFSFPELVPRQG